MKNLLTVLLLLSLIAIPATAQNRGGDSETGAVEIADARNFGVIGKQWAVFIAIDKYREWDPLDYAVRDAREIQNILRLRYLIDSERELFNEQASAEGIRSLFRQLKQEVGEKDSVFVFHAGHGVKDNDTNTGAWITADAGSNQNRKDGWISHEEVRTFLDQLPAPHVFLVSDSCYSGDLLTISRSGAVEKRDNNYYRKAYSFWSRQVMSSGASEQVPDVSDFARRLKDTLNKADGYCIDPMAIFLQVRDAKGSTPRLGTMPLSRNEIDGTFLFFKKDAQEFLASLPAINQPPAKPTVQGAPGEKGFFTGSWTANVEYNNSIDTYQINLSANGRCTVKLINDIAEQETTGNWSYDGTFFRLTAVFRNAKIAYQRNIQWVSVVNFAVDNNAFNILAKPAANASNNIRFTFFRDN